MNTSRTAALYWDTSDPAAPGWAWRWTDARLGDRSGPVDGDLPEGADLVDVLDAAGSDLPDDLRAPALWSRTQGATGWELRLPVADVA